MNKEMKYDVLIKSSPKDYHKLKYVINSLRFLNPQPCKIFLINPDGFKPIGTDYDDLLVVIKDDEVFPGCDRNKISYRKNWCFATFIALFQDVTEQDFYLDVQSDNFFVSPIHLFSESGRPRFFMSPQHSHYHQPYFNFSKKMFDLERVGDDSFIIDFMMYSKNETKKMLSQYRNFDEFFEKACENINENSYPTEQDCYANWCLKHNVEYDVIKGIPTILRGKHYPDNWSDEEITRLLSNRHNSVALSLHTWGDKDEYEQKVKK